MIANKYQINLSTLSANTTDLYVNIPITMDYQIADQSDLVKRVFVDTEREKSINPIVDYDKVRYLPLDTNNINIDKIIYNVNFTNTNTYGGIGFTDDDIKYRKSAFKNSFLNLNFYDSDNPLTQNLINIVTLFSEIKSSDLVQIGSTDGIIGQPKHAKDIPINYILENPILNKNGFSEGFYLYDYKDDLKIGDFKYLYMRTSFNNAKNGKSTNMMVKSTGFPIDILVHELYTRFKLIRNSNGYFYQIDNTYQGYNQSLTTNNVSYTYNIHKNTVTIDLYEIIST